MIRGRFQRVCVATLNQSLRLGKVHWLIVFVLAGFGRSLAQEGAWSLSASGGVGVLQMATVNETLDKTVATWNADTLFIPLEPFDHFKSTPYFSACLVYRYDRDFAVSLSVSYFSRTLTNSYKDPERSLSLERSVGSTDILLGISYFFPPFVYRTESYAFVELGTIFAQADASTMFTVVNKNGPVFTTDILVDTKAVYRKTRLIVNAGLGGTVVLWEPLFFKVEANYRFAQIGTMDGEFVRLTGKSRDASVTEFNFSVFAITVGLGIEF